MSIKTFKMGNVAEDIYKLSIGGKITKEISKGYSSEPGLIKKAVKVLNHIDFIVSDPLKELHNLIPGSRPHKLTIGEYAGYYSIWIDRKWRVCFEWGADFGADNHAYEVEINKHYGDRNS